jgi:hypothetical protein
MDSEIKLLYVFTGIGQISKLWADGVSQISLSWNGSFTNKQEEEKITEHKIID